LGVCAGLLLGASPFVGTAHANGGGGPTVLGCEQSFASEGLALIRAFQASDKGFHARFLLAVGLEAAELNFETCVRRATT
jgi:hypothetical protein